MKLGVFLVIGSISLMFVSCGKKSEKLEAVKIGVLFSQTGPISMLDKSIMEVISMAIDEINAAGGLLGRKLKIVTYDTASRLESYTVGAKELLEKEKVVVLLGCDSSIARRNVRTIVEENKGILIYPMHYEGGDLSPNILYVGAAPNQQIIPGVVWAMKNLGQRFFLIGTDSIYPHVVNAIMKDLIYSLNGEVIGESYIGMDSDLGLDEAIERIDNSRPDVILNTLEGAENFNFFKRLREAGITPDVIPSISFTLTENALRYLTGVRMEGDYSVWGYFQSISSQANAQFEQNFFAKYGKGRVIDDPMESMYVGIQLWAQAVQEAGTFLPIQVLKAISNQSYAAPSGLIYIDPDTHAAYRPVRIAAIQPDQQPKIVWNSEISVLPTPYTIFRTTQEWNALIQDLYTKWGNQWFRGKE